MVDFLKVEGSPDLLRDKKSKAIINNNHDAFERAKENKRKKLEQAERLTNLEQKIEGFEQKLDLIIQKLGEK